MAGVFPAMFDRRSQDSVLCQMKENQQMDLSELLLINKLTKTKPSLPRFAVNIANNILNNKPQSNLEALLVLDLAHNRLEKLPQNLGLLVQLRTLLLNDNFLKDINYQLFEKLQRLETLVIRNNLLTHLQIVKCWGKSLHILDISQNHLKAIPYQIGELEVLKQLYLSHNNFTSLPYQIMFLRNNLNLIQLDWIKYSRYPIGEILNNKVAVQEFFEVLQNIFFNSPQLLLDEEHEGIQFTVLISHPIYLQFAQKYQLGASDVQPELYIPSCKSLNSTPKSSKQIKNDDENRSQQEFNRDDLVVVEKQYKRKKFSQNKLHLAVIHEDLGVLRSLLKEDRYTVKQYKQSKRKLINQVDEQGHTPLSLAIMEEKYLAAKYILFSEANVNLGGGWFGSCLNLAISKLQFYLVRDLIKAGSFISKQDLFSNDPIHYLFSVFNSQVQDCSQIGYLLLSKGCNPNHRNARGLTPIHVAITKGCLSALQFSVKYNRQIEENGAIRRFSFRHKTRKDKNSCLHLAVQTRQISIVKLILSVEPFQVSYRNAHNLTANDYLKDDLTIFKLLLQKQSFIHRRQFAQGNDCVEFEHASTPTIGSNDGETINYTTVQTDLHDVDEQFDNHFDLREEQNSFISRNSSSSPLKQRTHKPSIQKDMQHANLGTLTRYIPLSPNNLKLIEQQSKAYQQGCEKNEISLLDRRNLQQKARLIKIIAYEFKQILSSHRQNYQVITSDQIPLSDRLGQLLLLKRVYCSLYQLIRIIKFGSSDILTMQWTKFLENQNQTQSIQMQMKDSQTKYDDVYSMGSSLHVSSSSLPYSTAMVKFFSQTNRQLEDKFDDFARQDGPSEDFYDKCLENQFLCNSFLSPHCGFGLQRMILFVNTENQLGPDREMIANQYELMQTRSHINISSNQHYTILNQKLFNRMFIGFLTNQQEKSSRRTKNSTL